jgi:aldose 1-epimerase
MDAALPADPTGRRFRLSAGAVSAEIAQVGAALRALTVGGIDVVPRYADDTPTPAAAGIVLVPWPNRVRDGRWTQRGTTRQLALSEPALGNASHGLLRFAAYRPETEADGAVTLRADVFAQTGYPFTLENRVTYAVTAEGLAVHHAVRNVGADDAPVAVGAHPFLCISTADTADLVLRSSGATRLILDERKLPVGAAPVDASTDLRAGRRVGELDLDTAYHDLVRDGDGRARTTLQAPDGTTVTLWQGEGLDWTQVFTTDRFPGHPLAIAVEPMSAPADALNSGTGLRWLAPGESATFDWGITLTR